MTGPSAAASPPTAVHARTAPWRRSGVVGSEHQSERGRREQRRPCCLHEPEADEHPDARRGGAGRGGGGEDGNAEEEGPVAAVAVGQPPEEHQQGRVDDGVAVEHPGQLAQVRGLEVPGDLGQRHVDDEQVEAGEHHAGADDDQHLAGGGLTGLPSATSDASGSRAEFCHGTDSRALRSIMQPTIVVPWNGRASPDMHCSVAQCLEVVGEWWSMLIVRDAFLGRDPLRRLPAAPRDLPQHLEPATRPPRRGGRLGEGALQRAPAPLRLPADRQGPRPLARPHRHAPVGRQVRRSGRSTSAGTHKGCGQVADAVTVCSACGEPIGPRDVRAEPGPGMVEDLIGAPRP